MPDWEIFLKKWRMILKILTVGSSSLFKTSYYFSCPLHSITLLYDFLLPLVKALNCSILQQPITSASSIHHEFVDIILVGVMGKRHLNPGSLVTLSSVRYNELFGGFSPGSLNLLCMGYNELFGGFSLVSVSVVTYWVFSYTGYAWLFDKLAAFLIFFLPFYCILVILFNRTHP